MHFHNNLLPTKVTSSVVKGRIHSVAEMESGPSHTFSPLFYQWNSRQRISWNKAFLQNFSFWGWPVWSKIYSKGPLGKLSLKDILLSTDGKSSSSNLGTISAHFRPKLGLIFQIKKKKFSLYNENNLCIKATFKIMALYS